MSPLQNEEKVILQSKSPDLLKVATATKERGCSILAKTSQAGGFPSVLPVDVDRCQRDFGAGGGDKVFYFSGLFLPWLSPLGQLRNEPGAQAWKCAENPTQGSVQAWPVPHAAAFGGARGPPGPRQGPWHRRPTLRHCRAGLLGLQGCGVLGFQGGRAVGWWGLRVVGLGGFGVSAR